VGPEGSLVRASFGAGGEPGQLWARAQSGSRRPFRRPASDSAVTFVPRGRIPTISAWRRTRPAGFDHRSSSPAPGPTVRQARTIDTPYQLHHGDADSTVSLSYDQRLDSLLTAVGVEHGLDVYPGLGHNDGRRCRSCSSACTTGTRRTECSSDSPPVHQFFLPFARMDRAARPAGDGAVELARHRPNRQLAQGQGT
jgi:hypothetical protein